MSRLEGVFLRPSLRLFAEEMETRLRKNEARGHAQKNHDDLLGDLRLCCIKLETAVEGYQNSLCRDSYVQGEAADVANYAYLMWQILEQHQQ